MKGLFCSRWRFCSVISLLPIVLVSLEASEESSFVGTLSFKVEYDDITTPMRYYTDGNRLKVELGEPGDPYLIWIRGIEGLDGVAVLSPLEKKYSVEFDGPPMHDYLRSDGSIDKRRQPKEVILPEGTATEFKGFECVQYKLETEGPDTMVWMMDNAQTLPFQVTQIWQSLYDASRHIRMLADKHNGIPLKIERKNWRGKTYFSLELLAHDATSPTEDIFSIPEDYYQIASQIRGGRRVGNGGRGPDRGSR